MFINKIGTNHSDIGGNCQDFGLISKNFKIVCDGCSEGRHSEVGAKLFCHLVERSLKESRTFSINDIFIELLSVIGVDDSDIKDYLCFTVLMLHQSNDGRQSLINCGDGYVILEDNDGNITFEELTDGEYPKYYSYNFCNKEKLKEYKDGVSFDTHLYDQEKYQKVGIASDGLRYIVNSDNVELRDKFIELLKEGKESKVKRFINANQRVFKDDITIIF